MFSPEKSSAKPPLSEEVCSSRTKSATFSLLSHYLNSFLLIESKTAIDESIKHSHTTMGFLECELDASQKARAFSNQTKAIESLRKGEKFIPFNNERLMSERKSNRKWNFHSLSEKRKVKKRKRKNFIAFPCFLTKRSQVLPLILCLFSTRL